MELADLVLARGGIMSRDPLVHFLILGALLFGGDALVNGAHPPADRIEISADFVAGLADEHATRTGRAPSDTQLDALVQQFVDEEILHRQALALGLDQGDLIVRRRLIQKMRFLSKDRLPIAAVTDEDIVARFAAQADRYTVPARIDVEHAFFADGEAAAAAGRRALIGGADRTSIGDTFLRGHSFAKDTPQRLATIAGEAFAAAAESAPVGDWTAPVRSAHGAHVLRVLQRVPSRLATLADATQVDTARRVLETERRDAANRAFLDAARAAYDVRIESPAFAMAGGS